MPPASKAGCLLIFSSVFSSGKDLKTKVFGSLGFSRGPSGDFLSLGPYYVGTFGDYFLFCSRLLKQILV